MVIKRYPAATVVNIGQYWATISEANGVYTVCHDGPYIVCDTYRTAFHAAVSSLRARVYRDR